MSTVHTVTCPRCDGCGEITHPRWGARLCPDPTITCPTCHGNGETILTEDVLAMIDDVLAEY